MMVTDLCSGALVSWTCCSFMTILLPPQSSRGSREHHAPPNRGNLLSRRGTSRQKVEILSGQPPWWTLNYVPTTTYGGAMGDALGRNLRRLRGERPQASLAEEVGISVVAYRSLEAGRSKPRSGTLLGLARALNVRVEDLYSEAELPQMIRFRSHKRLKSRELIVSRVRRRLADFVELEDTLDDRVEYQLRGFH